MNYPEVKGLFETISSTCIWRSMMDITKRIDHSPAEEE